MTVTTDSVPLKSIHILEQSLNTQGDNKMPQTKPIKLSAFIGVKVSIFNDTDIEGGYLHVDEDDVLVVRDKPKNQNNGVAITEIASQLNDFISKISGGTHGLDTTDTTDLGNAGDGPVKILGVTWPEALWDYAKDTKLFIDDVYIKIVKSKDTQPNYEFAFAIRVQHGDTGNASDEKKLSEATGFPFFDVRELRFIIWRTENSTVLKEMNIQQINDMMNNKISPSVDNTNIDKTQKAK
jgi:hypothetical protein